MKVTTRKYFDIEVSIYLDERYCKKDFTHNITIMVYQSRKYYHHKTGLSLRSWSDISTHEEEKVYKIYNRVYNLCRTLYDEDSFSMDMLKMKLEAPLIETLSDLIDKRIESYTLNGQYATKAHYKAAKTIFESMFGRVPLAKLTPSHFQRMKTYMEQCKTREYSDTTIRIYLSDLKSIITEAICLGYLSEKMNPFKKSKYDIGKVEMPQIKRRSDCFLSKESLTVLWEHFLETRDKSLGVFLFSYLCGGINIADILNLKYDDWYYNTKGEEFMYKRRKTVNTSSLEIRIAIDDRIRTIIGEFSTPERGQLVFPYLKHAYTKEDVFLSTRVVNNTVSRKVKSICKKLGLGDNVTCTWARHSYSTVMNRECVPFTYIEYSMGHNLGVATHYNGGYTTAQMREFNKKLLAS